MIKVAYLYMCSDDYDIYLETKRVLYDRNFILKI